MRVRRIGVQVALGACLLAAQQQQACAQEAVALPAAAPNSAAPWQSFSFVSDGPRGPGWSRPDEIARAYFDDELPALFERTVVLREAVPRHGRLRWIFTGPHAGFTVELTPSKVRLVQRFYDSTALPGSGRGYAEREIRDDEQQYTGRGANPDRGARRASFGAGAGERGRDAAAELRLRRAAAPDGCSSRRARSIWG